MRICLTSAPMDSALCAAIEVLIQSAIANQTAPIAINSKKPIQMPRFGG